MLTPEQIQNLKPGDIIDIRGFVNLPLNNGNILAELRYEFDNRILPAYQRISTEFISLPSEHGTSAPTPKYDPCRKFKKGDIVKTVERWGRKVPDAVGIYGYEVPGGPENKEWVVQEAETSGMVEVLCKIGGEFCIHKLPFFHLELVTPVEEMLPYHIQKAAEFDAWHICNRNNDVIVHFNPDPCNLRMDMAEIEKLAQDQCDYLNERFRDLIGKVIPVEELEPYELVETTDYWSVEKENKELCLFWKKYHHNAKEAAEAEAARLNTEWRKEAEQ